MHPGKEPSRSRLVLNRDSALKLGAGGLLVVALATSVPALMRSEQPAPLAPDVGLPQAAILPSIQPTPAPDPALAARKAKEARRARRAARRAKKGRRRRSREKADPGAEAPFAAAPVTSAPVTPLAPVPPPLPLHEDFGFERP